MKTKGHRPNINEPIILWGMQFFDLAILTGVFALVMIAGGFINSQLHLFGNWVFGLIAFSYLICLVILRFSNKQGEASFLLSFISFHFYQPKHIRHYGKSAERNKGV